MTAERLVVRRCHMDGRNEPGHEEGGTAVPA